MFIRAVCFAANGSALFKGNDNNVQDNWITIEPNADFNRWMVEYRFKEFRQFIPTIYEDASRKQNDPWWRFSSGVDQFNLNRLKYIVPSNHMTMDELMSAWRPRKTKTGGLPNITHIPRKPESLGTEFKCSACTLSKVMMNLEIQRERMECKI